MWAIVGLGNPGRKYSRSRHNIGFMVIEELAARHGVELKERKQPYMAGKCSLEGKEAVFAEPLTFMNRSGNGVREVMREFNVPHEGLIVIHDDIDMETGRLRIRSGGGAGGHRGVRSVIESTGSREFIRIKIGIGRDEDMLVEDYVLSRFKSSELPRVKEAVADAAEAVAAIVREGVEQAMNTYNRKPDEGT